MTRTVAFGTAPAELRKIHDVVRQAQQAGIDAVRAGVSGADVDAAARDVIADAGYGDRFVHGLGHGVGLEIHEAPWLGAGQENVLPAGAVVTIEPGIYVPGLGGVRDRGHGRGHRGRLPGARHLLAGAHRAVRGGPAGVSVSTNDLKNGMTLELDGALFQVIEFQHVKPGKGGAFVRTKLRNVKTGAVIERTFNAGVKVGLAIVERTSMQFLYADGDDAVFMDLRRYEQIHVPEP